MKCKPNCAPGGTLSKTRLASCSGGILAGSTGEYWQAAPARYWPDTWQDPPARDTQQDTWRDLLVSYSEILSGILGGTPWLLWWGTWRDPLTSYSGGIFGGIHWRATQRDTWRDPAAGCSGGVLGGIHWRAALAGYSAGSMASGSGGALGGIHWPAALVGYSAGSTDELLWRDIRRDPLASHSGILSGILGGIHWRAVLVGYSAGSTGKPLWRRNPLASCSGGILGGGVV